MAQFDYYNPANRGGTDVSGIYNKAQENALMQTLSSQQNPMASDEFQRLKVLNPERAAQLMSLSGIEDEQRMSAMLQDAKRAQLMLANGDSQGAVNLLQERAQLVSQLGGNARDTMEIYNQIRGGKPQEAMQSLQNFISVFDPNFQSQRAYKPEISPLQTDPQTGQQYVVITDPSTQQPKRVDVEGGKAQTPDEKMQTQVRRALLDDAREVGRESFEQLKVADKTIDTMNQMITQIEKGANTGRFSNLFPSVNAATIELENLANQLGLNVVAATTFGALSESELRLALQTGAPTNMDESDLKDWLVRKRDAQLKLRQELRRMAVTLGRGKTTLSEYLEDSGYKEGAAQDSGTQEIGVQDESDPLGIM